MSHRGPLLFSGTAALLRRGKPRPPARLFPDKYRRVPTLLKPQQGGQQYFNEFLLRQANEEAAAAAAASFRGGVASMGEDEVSLPGGGSGSSSGGVDIRLPQADPSLGQDSSLAAIEAEMEAWKAEDGFQTQRGFNERQWYEDEMRALAATTAAAAPSSSASPSAHIPERVVGDDYFVERYGFSLLRRTQESGEAGNSTSFTHSQQQQYEKAASASQMKCGASGGLTPYSQMDLWAELPRYHADMIFLYLISRRRNTYAVAYDYHGKQFLHPYTVGNRGLKGGDRGFRGDGSTDNGHQVTSAYLNDLIPKIREARAAAGKPPLRRGDRVDLVVRVMGFYNGRQGAVRAVQDRHTEFNVRYVEDVTPFPLNGPKMPKGVFR